MGYKRRQMVTGGDDLQMGVLLQRTLGMAVIPRYGIAVDMVSCSETCRF